MAFWTYQLEMFNEKEQIWEKHKRIYHLCKDINGWDLCNVEGKRRNSHLIQVYFK